MSAIFFRPWIGDEYQAGLRYGKRVMILGESHYEWDADEKPDPDCVLAQRERDRWVG